jgi:secreted trypsin-like serine protease
MGVWRVSQCGGNAVYTSAALLSILLAPWIASGQPVATESPFTAAIKRHDQGLSPNTRITLGHDTTINENPWQVALVATRLVKNTEAQYCGGTVVAAHWVVTAAHCLDGVPNAAAIMVLRGTASLESGGHRVVVDQIIPYKPRNPLAHDYDIGLIHTAEALPGRIAVWKGDESALKEVTVSGWGALSWQRDPPRSVMLQAVTVPLVSQTLCNSKGSYDNAVTVRMFCAGDYQNGGPDSCVYDSGGPATISDPAGPYLLGIVSWGDGCGNAKKPGLYTKITKFADWVRTNTNQEVTW